MARSTSKTRSPVILHLSPRLKHPARLPFRNPSYRRPEFTTEHQAVVGLSPVLHRLLPLGGSKVLLARPEGVAKKHRMLAFPPGVLPFCDPTSDRMECGDVAGSLQDHRLEDDESLRVSLPVPHPLHLQPQRSDELSADLPTRRIIAPRWHDRKVTPPRLPI